MLSIIGVALSRAETALSLSSVETGLIGASALSGIFFGGLVSGYVTDRVGRQTMYTIDLVALIGGSILCLFVTEVWQLLALRFVLRLGDRRRAPDRHLAAGRVRPTAGTAAFCSGR